MTMEEIAREIADRAYTVGYSKTDSTIETDAALVREVTLPQTEEETLAETTVESTGQRMAAGNGRKAGSDAGDCSQILK